MDLIKYIFLGINMAVNAMIYLIGAIATFIQTLPKTSTQPLHGLVTVTQKGSSFKGEGARPLAHLCQLNHQKGM